MARIFTISFSYTSVSCNAMVSVRTTPFHTEFTIKLLEEDLADALPTSKIVSSSPGHYVFLNVGQDKHTPLMKEIIKAIANHMHAGHTAKS